MGHCGLHSPGRDPALEDTVSGPSSVSLLIWAGREIIGQGKAVDKLFSRSRQARNNQQGGASTRIGVRRDPGGLAYTVLPLCTEGILSSPSVGA